MTTALVPGGPRRDRVVSCPHADRCPGCGFIALSYADQLVRKRSLLESACRRYPEVEKVPVLATVPAEPITAYRERAKLVVSRSAVGLYARGSHDVVDIPECRVLDPDLAAIADLVRGLLPSAPALSALDLRRTDDGPLVVLVVPDGTADDDARKLAHRISSEIPGVAGVAVSRRAKDSAQVLGRVPISVTGTALARCRLREGGPFHYATHGAFTQAHRGQQRALAEAVLRAVGERPKGMAGAAVLDLFAGAGALSLELASLGADVVAVESFEPAARLASEAAREQSLRLDLQAVDATLAVQRLVASGRKFDAVVVNPPRRGLTPRLRADLATLRPRVLVYVSCEPATLARDLSDLVRKGLSARSLVPYDMMPLTEEVETLAILRPDEPTEPEVLYRDEQLLVVAKAPHEPTTPQGEYEGSLLDRVRRLGGTEQAVPVHRLDVGTSGVVLFALASEFVPALSRALTGGEKEYVALARGVVRDKGSIRRPLVERGRTLDARTRYAREEIVGGHSLVTVRPDEGRKHQIRRHLAAIGHAVVGDERYGHGPTNQHFSARHGLDRTFLHCARVAIPHAGKTLELTVPLAPDLAGVLEKLAQ